MSSEESSQTSIPSNQSLFTIEEKRNQKHRQRLYLDKIEREKREEAESEKTSQVIRENAIKRRQKKAEEGERTDLHSHPHDGGQASSRRENPGDHSSSHSHGAFTNQDPRPGNQDASGEIATESIQVVDKHEERKKKRKATISKVLYFWLAVEKWMAIGASIATGIAVAATAIAVASKKYADSDGESDD